MAADPRQTLSQEGFSEREVGEILRRATEFQHQAEDAAEGRVSPQALQAGAQEAGIPAEFIAQAIKDINAERSRRAAQTAKRQRRLTIAGIIGALCLILATLFSHMALNGRLAEVEQKQTQLENVLQRRHDLIPNLIAMAKAYAAHEQELIASINTAYLQLEKTQGFEQRQTLERALDDSVTRLMAAIRADPQASSVALFSRLSDEMAGAENRIAVERKRYNEAVASYNRTARSFPVLLVRPLLGFPARIDPFHAAEAASTPPRF